MRSMINNGVLAIKLALSTKEQLEQSGELETLRLNALKKGKTLEVEIVDERPKSDPSPVNRAWWNTSISSGNLNANGKTA